MSSLVQQITPYLGDEGTLDMLDNVEKGVTLINSFNDLAQDNTLLKELGELLVLLFSVCVCARVPVCVYMSVCVCVRAYTSVCISVFACRLMLARLCMCVYACAQACVRVCARARVFVYVFMCVDVRMRATDSI